MRTRLALAGMVLVGTIGGCAVEAQVGAPYGGGYAADDPDGGDYDERPGYDERVEGGDYRRPLDPYGDWVDDRSYGRVWRPRVDVGWEPYRDGSWAWTRWGWSWVAAGPWAFTFHYGRWVFADPFGWAWYPGSVWGPAWVDWHWNRGWVGWAPLAPFGVVSVNHYTFVNERDFCSPRLRRVIVRGSDVPDHVRRGVYDRRIVRPPDRDHIQRVARDPIRGFDHGSREGRRLDRGPREDGRFDNRPTRRVERRDDQQLRRVERPGRPFDDRLPNRIVRPNEGDRREDLARPRIESRGGYRTQDGPVERRIQRQPGLATGAGPWGHGRREGAPDGPPRDRRVERNPAGNDPGIRRAPESRPYDGGRLVERAPMGQGADPGRFEPRRSLPDATYGTDAGGGHRRPVLGGGESGAGGDDGRRRLIIRR